MRKLSLLFAVLMLLCCAACGAEPAPIETTAPPTTVPTTAPAPTETTAPPTTVPETTAPEVFRIVIPESTVISSAGLEESLTLPYTYEDGWQEKESFTVTASLEMEGASLAITMTYGDKYTLYDIMGTMQTESYYDENGRVIIQISYPLINPSVDKIENSSTWDEYGRVLTNESKTYNVGQAEPTVSVMTYTYTDTDTGSIGVYEEYSFKQELVYDQNYRQIADITYQNGQEYIRNENTYDEYGNLIRSVQYMQGQMMLDYVYTYTIVEVSAETAARLPQLLVQE